MVLVPVRVSAAVTVSSFTATAKGNQVLVKWTTATEISNVGFNLLRSTAQGGNYAKIAGLIPSANPMSILGSNYSYTDSAVSTGQTYFYKLQSVDSKGGTEQFGPASALVGASTPAPGATNTPVPTSAPTATKTAVPTNIPVATNTPVPNSTPTRTVAVPPTSTPAPSALVPAGTKPSPTQSRPTPAAVVRTQPEDKGVPTPAITSVAASADQQDAGGEVTDQADASSQTQDFSLDRSYYLQRLIKASVLLTSSALVLGAVVFSALALLRFLRAYLR